MKLVFFGEESLRVVLKEYWMHCHTEGNYQGKGNVLFFPTNEQESKRKIGEVKCRERLVGYLNFTTRKRLDRNGQENEHEYGLPHRYR